jgi:hypothetical protein
MTYKNYIKTMLQQPDKGIEAIRLMFKEDANFPDTNDVKEIARYVYNKLTPNKQTSDFQKILMFWGMETGKQIDLGHLNYVIDLQNMK